MPTTWRDRFFTRRVADAILSPSAILLAGGGTAAGVLVGLGPFAVLVGAAAYAARVLLAVPRSSKRDVIDAFAVSDPWRTFVRDALEAQNRFRQAVRSTREGPLRDRLAEIGERIETGVQECWRIAQKGDAIDEGRRRLEVDVKNARFNLQRIEQSLQGRQPDPTTARTIESLRAQLASDERLWRVSADAVSQLRLIDARLDEAVARAVELGVAGDVGAVTGLGNDVDDLVTELEALRLALEDTGAASRRGGLGSGVEPPGTALPPTATS